LAKRRIELSRAYPQVAAMRLNRLPAFLVGALGALALLAPAALAANVTIGSSLVGPFPLILGCNPPSCTVGQSINGLPPVSPIDGAVVRWRMVGGSAGQPYKLRVLAFSLPQFTSVASSATGTPLGTGLESFATAMPIKAGQTIGLDLPENANIGAREIPGARVRVIRPALTDGQTAPAVEGNSERELGFNAEIQPPPSISAVQPAEGPRHGGIDVEIQGSDLLNVTAVKFR
jgi:hypothetical protein